MLSLNAEVATTVICFVIIIIPVIICHVTHLVIICHVTHHVISSYPITRVTHVIICHVITFHVINPAIKTLTNGKFVAT